MRRYVFEKGNRGAFDYEVVQQGIAADGGFGYGTTRAYGAERLMVVVTVGKV